jgi:hypothetical protein
MSVVRIIVFAFTLSLASSVQAMPVSPLQTPDNMVVTVRQACGVGYQRVAAAACAVPLSGISGELPGGARPDCVLSKVNASPDRVRAQDGQQVRGTRLVSSVKPERL